MLSVFPMWPSRRASVVVAVYLAATSSGWPADEPVMMPERAVAIALEGNPGLAQIKARAEAMAAVPSQEGALPDPTLSLEALNLPTADALSLRKEDMTMLEVGVSQSVPFPGKRVLKQKAAEFEAEAAADTVDEARLRLVRDVKVRWWALMYMHRSLIILADTAIVLGQLVDIADAKYRLGEGLPQDVLAARLELAKLEQQRARHVGMHRSEIARLNALLNRSMNSPVRLPDEVDTILPDIRSEADLLAAAERSRPLLAQRKHTIDAAQTRLELAKKDYYPDFTLGAGYAFRQGTPAGQSRSDFANFRLSLNLPIYADDKQARAVDQRNSELLKERYALQEAERKTQTEIASALAVYAANREQVGLIENSVIPLAQQTVTSALSAYQVGKSDFLNVIRAENAWLDYRMQYWQAVADAQQALARLMAAVGREAT